MAIPTSRTDVKAEIRIDAEKCKGCGFCVSVCKDLSLEIVNNKVKQSDNSIFGCFACGHCMAICPTGAIEIYGREMSPEDIFELPPKEKMADYEQVLALFQHRRSIREFKNKDVEPEVLEKILTTVKTAPMGLPPSDVHLMILNGREKTLAFAKDYSEFLEKNMMYMTSKWFLSIMRLFFGKENHKLFKAFIKPLFNIYTKKMKEGENFINYNAPLAIYFYATPYSDPADPVVVATYAMIVAESLGLGTCMLGAVHPFIQKGKPAKKFREKHGIKHTSKEGIFVIFGYPKFKYKKGIRRTFASIN